MNTDVIVIGGGTAGVIAAVQSARAGANTLLVEKNGRLGGTITAAAVNFPGLFHAWGEQVIAGIGWELVSRCAKETGAPLPNFTAPGSRHWQCQIRMNHFIYTALCDEALRRAGCEVLLHAMPASVQKAEDGWDVQLCTKAGLETAHAHVLIDCTGDANLAALAGAELRTIEHPQPASLTARVSGYDFKSLDMEAINRAFAAEIEAGRLAPTDAGWDPRGTRADMWLAKYGCNANHFHAESAQTSQGRTSLELRSREAFLQLFRFLKTQPGLENLRVDYLAEECGVRETAMIVGDETITEADYATGRKWEDAVCYSFYPIDLHVLGDDDIGLDCRPLAEGVVPTVPRGALLPKGLENMIVAGRCISSDRAANSALRVQATCMATAQAAGALAALAVREQTTLRDVPHESLAALLRDHGAIVPE